MIRAENAITKLIDKCPVASRGLLVTENVLVGNVQHFQADGSIVQPAIPGWFNEEWDKTPGSMWWLCMQLKYAFSIDLNPQVRAGVDGVRKEADARYVSKSISA